MSNEEPTSVSIRHFGVSNGALGARTEGIEEVREGSEFILSAIGGQPSEIAVNRLLKLIGAEMN